MRRRRPSGFDPFWGFGSIDRMMEHFMNEAFKQMEGREGPLFYGFSISMGQKGESNLQEFGNVRPGIKGPQLLDGIEPLVDVVTDKENLKVYVELPGVEKDDIDLSLSNGMLTIEVEGTRRSYRKAIRLPYSVEQYDTKATYRNGVLEVVFEEKSLKVG